MTGLILNRGRIFDGHSDALTDECSIVIDGDRIVEVSENPGLAGSSAHVLDLAGRTLMPGLIDAHVHVLAQEVNLMHNDEASSVETLLFARTFLESALCRGFTSLRDAGGADFTLARAVEKGLINGPRLFFSGFAISQTGGHGDFRNKNNHAHDMCACTYNGKISRIADGVDQVRALVREQLRLGATQIKLMVSGGVSSPADPIWMLQYSDDEIAAAVEEAARSRTYVMGHAYTAESIGRAVRLGVRTVEHGNLIDAETAAVVRDNDAFVVPTLATYKAMDREGPRLGMDKNTLSKNSQVLDAGIEALDICRSAGVSLGFGTDLLGSLHSYQTDEFQIRNEVLSPAEILRSATSVNAKILNREGKLGCVSVGAIADLIVVDGNPLENLGIFTAEGENIPIVVKGGRIVKNEMT